MELLIIYFSPPSDDLLSTLGPNIPHSSMFSNTLRLYCSPDVKDECARPYKITDKVVVSYI
jgi:hypothetical protein